MTKKKQDVFQALKEQFHVAPPEFWSCRLQNIRVPKGNLVEVVGEARFEWMIQCLEVIGLRRDRGIKLSLLTLKTAKFATRISKVTQILR